MEDEDAEEMREATTLVNKYVKKTSSKKISSTRQRLVKKDNSNEESDTMECPSENEVENIPPDDDPEPIVTDEKGNRISGRVGKSSESIDTELPNVSEEVSEVSEVSEARLEVRKTEIQRHTTTARIQIQSSSSSNENENPPRTNFAKYGGARLFMSSTRSPQSSSSQEEYEPEVKTIPNQNLLTIGSSHVTARSMESLRTSKNFLSADDRFCEDSRSMESLSSSSETHMVSGSKGHYRSFLTSSKKDLRRIVALESRSSDNLYREESLNAEVRRGLFANMGLERRLPQHLSLPPPSGVFSLTSPGGSDRRITILSPHSPLQVPDFQQSFSVQTLKNRRKKAIVLPRLVLPRSESEVFLE